jgi:hypothetical protein
MRRLWSRLTGRPLLDAEALARGDPWIRLPVEPPLLAYGPGCHDEFGDYLVGSSRVRAATPNDVAAWLLTCRYAPDADLLGDHDHWLHPSTFEVVRAGDCEDYALWAWRKLVELDLNACFVVGIRRQSTGECGRHAWATFHRDGEEYLLDGVERAVRRIIRPIREARADYEPQVGVSPSGHRFAFAGLYRTSWGRELAARSRSSRQSRPPSA